VYVYFVLNINFQRCRPAVWGSCAKLLAICCVEAPASSAGLFIFNKRAYNTNVIPRLVCEAARNPFRTHSV